MCMSLCMCGTICRSSVYVSMCLLVLHRLQNEPYLCLYLRVSLSILVPTNLCLQTLALTNYANLTLYLFHLHEGRYCRSIRAMWASVWCASTSSATTVKPYSTFYPQVNE